jgi:hypothetical protein
MPDVSTLINTGIFANNPSQASDLEKPDVENQPNHP